MDNWPLIALLMPVVLFSGFVRGLTGFGGPLILVPIMVLFMSPPSTAAIVMFVDICSNIGLLREAFRLASMRIVLYIVLSSFAAIPIGSYFMLSVDPQIVEKIIYISVGIAAVVLFVGFRFPRPLKPYELVAGGGIAGIVMGITALGIAIVPVLFSMPNSVKETRANLIVWVFFVSTLLFLLLVFQNSAGHKEIIIGAMFAPIYLIGAVLGKKCFVKLDEKMFRKYVLGFLFVVSITGLLL